MQSLSYCFQMRKRRLLVCIRPPKRRTGRIPALRKPSFTILLAPLHACSRSRICVELFKPPSALPRSFSFFIKRYNHLRQWYSRLNAMMLSRVLSTLWRFIQYIHLIGSGLISRGHPSSHQAKYPWLDQIQIGMILRHLRSSRRPDQSETIQRREVNCDPRSLKIP